jgi:hypothetical protein
MVSSTIRPSPIRTTAIIAVGCAYAAAMTYAILVGPGRYAASEQAADAKEDAESQAVCGRLGISSGSADYAACASELAMVRQRREQRVQRRGD